MPLRPRDLLRQPVLDCLRSGPRPAWEIEDELARRFKLTPAERQQMQRNGQALGEW